MAYRFKRSDRDVQAALRRIACEQADLALAAMKTSGPELHGNIHEARKSCKKLRGLIRLVRPVFPDYAMENRAIRDAARELAELRQRGAGLETLDRLAAARPKQVPRAAVAALRAALMERASAAEMPELAARCDAFAEQMQALRGRAAAWILQKQGARVLKQGFKASYQRARKGMKQARTGLTGEALHDWRKQVKHHWYHCRLLDRIGSKRVAAQIALADELAELLGERQDLEDFEALLADPGVPQDACAALRKSVRKEIRRVEKRAFRLGPDLLSPPAQQLCRKWHHRLKPG